MVGQTTLTLGPKKCDAEGEGEQHATTPQKPSSPVKPASTTVKVKRPKNTDSNQEGGARKRKKAVREDKKETPTLDEASDVVGNDDEEPVPSEDDSSIESLLGEVMDKESVTGVAGDAREGDSDLKPLATDEALGVCSDMLAGKFDTQICIHNVVTIDSDDVPRSPWFQNVPCSSWFQELEDPLALHWTTPWQTHRSS